MRMGKYGRGVAATTDEETEDREEDFGEEEETIDRRMRTRKNSRRAYPTDDEDDEFGDERRLEVHQSREELDQEDKPAMQALKKTFSQMLSRMPWVSTHDTSDISDNCSTISRGESGPSSLDSHQLEREIARE